MLRGMAMTLAVSMSSFLLGIVIGCGGAAIKLSSFLPSRIIGDTYTTVIRGVPELLVLYLLFFAAHQAVMLVARVFGYTEYIELDAFTIGTIAIGFVSGAYSTEVIRGAVLAVPKGQIEAAKAVGMSRWLRFWRILLPQALPVRLPGLGNVWQLTLKDTSLISVTGLVEIMRTAQVAAGSTKQPFTFYLVAAALYLILTSASNFGIRRLERWGQSGCAEGQRMNFELMVEALPKLASGIPLTLQLVSLSLLLGFIFAVGLALMRLSENRVVSRLAYGYVYYFRGTPLLVQIFSSTMASDSLPGFAMARFGSC